MSLINYEHVGRVKTTNQNNHLRAASRLRNKQRKWRVLLSIGLLLPTLAAIIGIVAWAISIEVANTSQSPQISALTGSSNNYNRKLHHSGHHHHQQEAAHHHAASKAAVYQQIRRQNGLGSSSSTNQAPNEIISRDDQSSNEARLLLEAPEAVAEPEPSAGDAARASRNVASPATGGNRAQVDRKRASATATAAAAANSANGNSNLVPDKTKSESGPEEKDRRSSTILLTNLGQVEAFDQSNKDKPTSIVEKADGANSDDKESNDADASSEAKDTSESESETESKAQNKAEEEQVDTVSVTTTVAPIESSQEIEDSDASKAQAREQEDEKAEEQKVDEDHPVKMKPENAQNRKKKVNTIKERQLKSSKNKSQLGEEPTSAAAEAEETSENQTAREQPKARVAHGNTNTADRSGLKNGGRSLKSSVAKVLMAKGLEPNNRYTIVEKEANNDGSDVDDAEEVASGGDAQEAVSAGSKADRSDTSSSKDEQEDQESFSGGSWASGNRANTGPSQAARFSRPEDEQRHRYGPPTEKEDQKQQQRDDELSFEAIASAISTTLSANAQQQADENSNSRDAPLAPANSDKINPESESDSDELTEEHSPLVFSANDGRDSMVAARRRTPGQHVAEVIDHIVERRKQSSGLAIGGPQIVVVAPVGGSELKARSLTMERTDLPPVQPQQSKTSGQRKPMSEDKRSSSKKETAAFTNDKKPASRRATKPLAARLLGVGGDLDQNGKFPNSSTGSVNINNNKYSERVEVIEDDDSSDLLYGNPNDDGNNIAQGILNGNNDEPASLRRNDDIERISSPKAHEAKPEIDSGAEKNVMTLEQLLEDQPASIHVASLPSEPRLRSPRHGSPINLAFERYARPLEDSAERGSESTGSGARIYSAEKLILDHVLKSKVQPQEAIKPGEDIKRSSNENQESPATRHTQQPKNKPQQQQQQQQQQQKQHVNKQVKVAPTTVRPHSSTSSPDVVSNKEQESRQYPRFNPTSDQLQTIATSSNGQSIQVPSFMHQAPEKQAQQYYQHQSANRPETYQSAESHQPQPQSQFIDLNNQHNHRIQMQQQYQHQSLHNQPETMQQSSSEAHQQNLQQQQQQPQIQSRPQQQQFEAADRLPTFADQEYNVPAHMAESVIQNIQLSPVSFNMVNGRPTLIGGMGQQVPYLQQPNGRSPTYHHPQYVHNQPPQQQYPSAVASEVQPVYQASQQYQAWRQIAAANSRLQQQLQQIHPQHQFTSLGLQRPSLTDRSTNTISLSPTKGLVHPVAQFAIRHLLGSLGRQKPISSSRQETSTAAISASSSSAAADPPALLPASQVSSRSSIMELQKSPITQTESIQAADSMPVQSSVFQQNQALQQQAMMPSASRDPVAALPAQREAASGPTQDQDMEESYGQIPTYHMAPRAPHYGGGGGQHHYQVDEHDKKSKGITFHFGGGPIGGGTQLITSPMGIFKHLMIPLLPNPRVNLNGKVVFGVVLEKSTAIGEPKKKFKFWGR